MAIDGFMIARSVFDHPLFSSKREFSRLEAWVWMLSEAAWKPRKISVSGKTVVLDRGQVCHSVRYMAEAWGWSKSSVERFLTRLKTETMIDAQSGTGQLVITVCNYDTYQLTPSSQRDSSGTETGTAAGQQRDKEESSNQEIIKSKEDNSLRSLAPQAASAKKRGTRLSAEWVLPKSYGDWALSKGLPRERILIEADKMRNWSINAGKTGVKVDWFAAWQNWVQGAIDDLPKKFPSQKPSMVGILDNLISDMEQAENVQFNEGGIGFAQNAGYLASPKR